MIRTAALLAAAALALAQAGSADERHAVASGGRERTYRLHAPASLPPDRPAPLVLVFHGGEGDGRSAERLTGFDAGADREGYLVAYPDAFEKHWNDGRDVAAFTAYRERIDDVAFVAALLDDVAVKHAVDLKRVFATGISNGAIFANFLALRLADRIAAIAPVAGGLAAPLPPTLRPARPVSVLLLNGTDDPLVPYDGGAVARTHGRVVGAEETARRWAQADGCSASAARDAPPARPGAECAIERSRWSGGREGTEVLLYTLKGGGHTWPGGPQSAPRPLVGRVCREPDATRTIWEFFCDHPRRGP
ncbi:MAG: alpha/beta hydrolase family esterase [Syntrophomonadaceae bacterium]